MKIVYHRTLPHLQPPGGRFFVTFRLKDSLPEAILQDYRAERDKRLSNKSDDRSAEYNEKKRLFAVFDGYLDRCLTTNDYLKEDAVARIMAEVIHGRDGQTYDLIAYCIMPNHVHVILELTQHDSDTMDNEPEKQLYQVLGSMKSYSAKLINQHLGRSGAFWQHESYDHLVRDIPELKRIISYVLLNPVKAGLVENWQGWAHTYISDTAKPDFA